MKRFTIAALLLTAAANAFACSADDVIAALRIDPTNLDALVLRGDLSQKGVDIRADYAPALEAADGR